MICKLKLHSKGFCWKNLKALHALENLEPLFKFPIHLSVGKSPEIYRQTYGKSKASLWRNLSTGTPPKFFRTFLCFVALLYNWYFFFRTAVLRKSFAIRFSYKNCNFSRVCLLVKIASKTVTVLLLSKTVTRSINLLKREPISRVHEELFHSVSTYFWSRLC